MISFRIAHETRLRELLLKKLDPTFQETQKTETTLAGGAVLVPQPASDVGDWPAIVAALSGIQAASSAASTETSSVPSPGMGLSALDPAMVVKSAVGSDDEDIDPEDLL